MNINSLKTYWGETALPILKHFWNDHRVRYGALGFFALAAALWFFNSAPSEFPVHSIISVKEGEALAEVSQSLKDARVIRSELIFEMAVILRGGEKHVVAGDYVFAKPLGAASIAERLTTGTFGLTPVRITILEGATVRDISLLLGKNLWNFDTQAFIAAALPKEGYLFPDTYFFLPNTTPQNAISTMNQTFTKKIKGLETDIEQFGKPLKDVIIMASIVEREAATPEDRRIVSGILWKRIAIGMPLQVDAAFVYVNGETTKDLSTDDLKIDSPYNTYRYKGLPAGPISNPGLDAIEAAVNPQQSPYLYYLSDKKGIMHYSKTFEEHKINKEKYVY